MAVATQEPEQRLGYLGNLRTLSEGGGGLDLSGRLKQGLSTGFQLKEEADTEHLTYPGYL